MPGVRESETIEGKMKTKCRPGSCMRSRLAKLLMSHVQRGAATAVDGRLFFREIFNAAKLYSDYTVREANYKHLLCLNRGSFVLTRSRSHGGGGSEEKRCFKEMIRSPGHQKWKKADLCSFTEDH